MQPPRSTSRAPKFKRLTLALAAAWPALALAAPASNSPYRTDAQSTHVEDATSRGIGTVNMITCIMSALRADALVNQGNYLALVDESKCDNNRASADNSSGSSSNAPSYMQGIVNSTRATNSDPMRMKAWLSMPQDGEGMTIFVNLTATEAPSDTNPYGAFRIDYCGQPDAMPGQCMMQGYLIGSASGIQYYEVEQGGGGGGGGGQSIKQLALTRSGADGGSGRLSYAEDGSPQAYSFAYDAAHFLRSNGSQDQCFSRLAAEADASVWRYGLYDSNSGARITRNSGFPIEYGSGASQVRGYMGYWGLSVPGDAAAPANGDTIYKVAYSNNGAVKTPYTYAGAAGRLTKYSKTSKSLVAIDGVRFTLWVNDRSEVLGGSDHAPAQLEVYWKQLNSNFVVAGLMECNNGPCVTRDVTTDVRIDPSYFSTRGGVRGYSQALGGELFIAWVSGSLASEVTLRTQSLVYPNDMPTDLECLSNCPTDASVPAYFTTNSEASSPYAEGTAFNYQPTADTVAYTLSNGLLKHNGNPVTLTTSTQDLQQSWPQYMGGLRSGRLFRTGDKASLTCGTSQYCDYKVEALDEYFIWETGPSAWNQFAALKDTNNHYVEFDAPLNVDYTVPLGTAYGAYQGRSLVLQYGGFGELWGLPGHCVSAQTNQPQSCDQPQSRYVPEFVIPDTTTDGSVTRGSDTYYAKWLDRELRFARKDVAQCSALSLPTGLALPTEAGLKNPSLESAGADVYIGAKPSLSADVAPRVIHGEVKY